MEHAEERERERIEDMLRPPVTAKVGRVPVWYGSDDDAWAEFANQAPAARG
jgi:hypothetical protein